MDIGHAMVQVEGVLYMFGGVTHSQAAVNLLHVFDPAGSVWAQGPSCVSCEGPSARSRHAMAVVAATFFVFGGLDNSSHILDDLYQFDSRLGRWNKLPSSSICRAGHAMVLTLKCQQSAAQCNSGVDVALKSERERERERERFIRNNLHNGVVSG